MPKDVWIACEHVEGHAAGIMRNHPEIKKGTITINNKPCGYCENGIPHILNKDQILVVEYVNPGFGDQNAAKKTGYWIGGQPGFHDGLPPQNESSGSNSGGAENNSDPSNSGKSKEEKTSENKEKTELSN